MKEIPACFLSVGEEADRKMKTRCMLSCFSHAQLFATVWTIVHQAPLSMGFSRQGYWSALPCPPPEDLPNPGFEPASPVSPALQTDSLLLIPGGSPFPYIYTVDKFSA